MSKNIKTNDKIANRFAFKAKKNICNNYKIESLEPRFMMDANVDLDGFGNQIDNFSSVVENRVDTLINPQKNFEIQQSAPLSAADIQALLSIDPDNLGGSGNIKV